MDIEKWSKIFEGSISSIIGAAIGTLAILLIKSLIEHWFTKTLEKRKLKHLMELKFYEFRINNIGHVIKILFDIKNSIDQLLSHASCEDNQQIENSGNLLNRYRITIENIDRVLLFFSPSFGKKTNDKISEIRKLYCMIFDKHILEKNEWESWIFIEKRNIKDILEQREILENKCQLLSKELWNSIEFPTPTSPN